MVSFIIRLLLFGIPIVILPFGASHFEIPKVILAELGIQILFVYFLWHNTFHQSDLRLYVPFIIILLLSILHMIFFPSATGVFGNPFRLQGTFMLWNLLLFAVITTKADTKKTAGLFPLVTLIFLFASVFVYGTNGAARAIGSLGEPNALAATAIFCFPFAFCNASGPSKRFLQIVACACVVYILAVSHSRSAAVGWALELLIIWGMIYKRLPAKLTIITIAFLLGTALLLPLFETGRVYENRLEIWGTAAVAVFRYPLTGWGFGNTEHALAWGARQLSNNLRFQYVDSSHNIILDWWIQAGVVGLSALLYFIMRAIKHYIKHHEAAELAAMFGILAALLFNPTSITVLLAFWWLVGRGYAAG